MTITQEQYKAAIQSKDEAQATINQFHKERQKAFNARIASGTPFTDDELIYSAETLCPCGHGLAYPRDCGMHHYWDCSATLKGSADRSVEHTGRLPFSFYEVKSEQQPGSKTTRGVFRPKPAVAPEEPKDSP